MASTPHKKSSDSAGGATVGYEARLWAMADALRGSMNAANLKRLGYGG